ncbi:MAG: hypothetical protein OXE05_11935 [Chloroflexi bacterium]|nr:hypothetical protein [Chloroflexota bacterium]
MTAEIAVMNQEAVALAADSAVSIVDGEYEDVTKIFTSANKLFALSQYFPVGIMINGNTRLGEVPWETVIKLYRDHLGTEGRETIEDYTSDFIRYINVQASTFRIDQEGIGWSRSGIVVAGFGEKEIYPAIVSLEVLGFRGQLIYRLEKPSIAIGGIEALILPYAQKEVVQGFMNGVEPSYKGTLLDIFEIILSRILADTLKESERDVSRALENAMVALQKELDSIEWEEYAEPVLGAIAEMPKSELPAVAEALVGLQSLKRKVSEEHETVGGPIDVALISKGDGFIWIKRKHYFNPEINPQYFQRFKGGQDERPSPRRTV